MPNFILNPEQYDPAWDGLPAPEVPGGLTFSQVRAREEWIVKLEFLQEGMPCPVFRMPSQANR
jgi:hypothetical protein